MAKVTFNIEGKGARSVDGIVGLSVMEVALHNGIEGIQAECMGSCACATCHVVVDDEWVDHIDPLGEIEDELLDILDNRQENSRLSCQIRFLKALDGLIVTVPLKAE